MNPFLGLLVIKISGLYSNELNPNNGDQESVLIIFVSGEIAKYLMG